MDAEEENKHHHKADNQDGRGVSDNDDDDYDDTIAGMLNSGGSGSGKPNLQCNMSMGENNMMISFDASRISPSNNNANNHLDTSHANMKNMVG